MGLEIPPVENNWLRTLKCTVVQTGYKSIIYTIHTMVLKDASDHSLPMHTSRADKVL